MREPARDAKTAQESRNNRNRITNQDYATQSMKRITIASKQSAKEVRHKLYMRIMMRMTETFGQDSRSIKAIKDSLDKNLEGRSLIDSGVSTGYSFLSFYFLFSSLIKLKRRYI